MPAMMRPIFMLVVAATSILVFIPTVVSQTVCANTSLSANGTDNYLTSPGYPNNYPNNMDCQWIIITDLPSQVVALKLFDFHLDSNCSKDYVAIYDGVGTSSTKIATLCGEPPVKEYVSSGSNMTVVFHSDSNNTFPGFRFLYVNSSKLGSSGLANLIIYRKGDTGRFYSPNYPSNYLSHIVYQVFISTTVPANVIALKLLDFELESSPDCTFDYVTIYDGSNSSSPIIRTICGTLTSGQFTSSGPAMTVLFRSDLSYNFKGFEFEYSLQSSSGFLAAAQISVLSLILLMAQLLY